MICRNTARLATALLLLPCLLAPVFARAQAPGDAVEGGKLAATWCSNCHQVNLRMRGDVKRSGPNPAAPSFAAIAAMPSTTALSINVFLRTIHNGMPNYQLSPVQIDDAAAYIISLRRPQME
jgi:mono/diheme cytochrome c family protein